MASYIADRKEETEGKNELIELLTGVLMTQNDTTLELKPESEAMWAKSDSTKFLAPTASQRSDYILHVRKQVVNLGRSGKLWLDRENARARGMEAVHEFQENEALATQLRDAASKLTSAAAHISFPNRPGLPYVPPSGLQRKREENFGRVEETLLEAVRVVRGVKKFKQCYQLEPLQIGPSTSKDTPSAPSYSAPSTRPVLRMLLPGISLGTQAKVTMSTDPQGTTAAAIILASEAVAPLKKSNQTKGPTSKEKSPGYMRKLIATPSTCEELPTLRTSSGRRIIKPSSRRLLGIVSDHEDDSGWASITNCRLQRAIPGIGIIRRLLQSHSPSYYWLQHEGGELQDVEICIVS